MKARFIPWPIAGGLLVLAGCGGGGGGSTVGGPSPPPDELVEISAANAKTVTADVMQSALEGGNFATLADPSSTTIDSLSTKTSPLYSKVSASQVDRDAALVKQSAPISSEAPIGPATEPCDFGGTITISGDVASQETLTAGDRLSMAFDQCDDGTTVVDGTFSMTIQTFSGSLETGAFSLSVTVGLDSLATDSAAGAVAIDGDATLTIDTSAPPQLAIRVSSGSLAIDVNGTSHTVSDYLLIQSVDTQNGDYSMEVSGAVSSSKFEGEAIYETVETFVGLAGAHPYVGELLISGAGGATIRAVALDDAFVRLTVDTDGDGAADFTEDVAWEELIAL